MGCVRPDAGGEPTYEVVTDELVAAAQAVLRVTDQASSATVEQVPATVSEMGHAGLAAAFREFCARWDAGLPIANGSRKWSGTYANTRPEIGQRGSLTPLSWGANLHFA
jgi:hypothetical protein